MHHGREACRTIASSLIPPLLVYRASRAFTIATMLPSQRQEDFTDTARCTPRSLDDINLSVLVANDHFFVIDKPPDVRMDGQFDVTVKKLAMKALRDHPSADIHNLKWIHQLDFATSGVLCVGLTRAAAAAASSCFEHREVDKTYVAVLSGHLDVSKLPIALYEPVQEGVLPKRRKLSPVPANACWQTEAKAINASALWTALHELDVTTLSAEVGRQVPDMLAVSFEEYSRNAKRRKQLRKLLADAGVEVETVSSSATLARDSGVDAPAPPVQKALEEAELDAVLQTLREATPPCLFRAQGVEEKVIIRVPVAEVMGDFRMEPGHAGNPGKVSETELTVLGHAWYQVRSLSCALCVALIRIRTGRVRMSQRLCFIRELVGGISCAFIAWLLAIPSLATTPTTVYIGSWWMIALHQVSLACLIS